MYKHPYFKTEDFVLASSLIAHGYEFKAVLVRSISNKKRYFIFISDNDLHSTVEAIANCEDKIATHKLLHAQNFLSKKIQEQYQKESFLQVINETFRKEGCYE